MESIQININSERMSLDLKAVSNIDIELAISLLEKLKFKDKDEFALHDHPKTPALIEIPVKNYTGKKRGRKKKVLETSEPEKKTGKRGKKVSKLSEEILSMINGNNTQKFIFDDFEGLGKKELVYNWVYSLLKANKIKRTDNGCYASLDFIEESKEQVLEVADLKSIEFDELEDKILKYIEEKKDTLIDVHKIFFDLDIKTEDYANAYKKLYSLHKRLSQVNRYRGDFNKTYISYGEVRTLPFDVKIIQRPIIKGEMANLWKEGNNKW